MHSKFASLEPTWLLLCYSAKEAHFRQAPGFGSHSSYQAALSEKFASVPAHDTVFWYDHRLSTSLPTYGFVDDCLRAGCPMSKLPNVTIVCAYSLFYGGDTIAERVAMSFVVIVSSTDYHFLSWGIPVKIRKSATSVIVLLLSNP